MSRQGKREQRAGLGAGLCLLKQETSMGHVLEFLMGHPLQPIPAF